MAQERLPLSLQTNNGHQQDSHSNAAHQHLQLWVILCAFKSYFNTVCAQNYAIVGQASPHAECWTDDHPVHLQSNILHEGLFVHKDVYVTSTKVTTE